MNIKKILIALRYATGQDIVSKLKREFGKVQYLNENEIVALYNTVSSLADFEEHKAVANICSNLQKACIARMVEIVRIQEGEIRERRSLFRTIGSGYEVRKDVNTEEKFVGPFESRLRTLRSKFYETTRDGSFIEI